MNAINHQCCVVILYLRSVIQNHKLRVSTLNLFLNETVSGPLEVVTGSANYSGAAVLPEIVREVHGMLQYPKSKTL